MLEFEWDDIGRGLRNLPTSMPTLLGVKVIITAPKMNMAPQARATDRSRAVVLMVNLMDIVWDATGKRIMQEMIPTIICKAVT